MTKAELMGLIGERDALDAKIDAATKELGLEPKDVKAMQKAASKAAAAKKTLDALMGLDLAEPASDADKGE